MVEAVESWDATFLGLAERFARRSKDPSTKVGCVIVGPDREVRSMGYNGLPRGVEDLAERMERPAKYLWTSHAEENAVAQAARIGVSLKECTAYVTHFPCARCARAMIQAGIIAVKFGNGTTNMPSDEFEVANRMLTESNIKPEQVQTEQKRHFLDGWFAQSYARGEWPEYPWTRADDPK